MPHNDPQVQRAIELAAEAIVTARDVCGNEREASEESFLDSGIKPTDELLFEAYQEAERQWQASQQAAGVKHQYRR